MNSELNFPDDYIISTPRLQLRPPTINDVEGLWPHVSDPDITRYLAWEPHADRSITAAMIESLCQAQKDRKSFHWLVCVDNVIAGLVSLIDVRGTHRSWIIDRAELSYWLGKNFQGHGYATEAGREVMKFGFSQLRLHKIIVAHAADNPPSGRVAERLGFRHYAIERDAFNKNGIWHKLLWYDITSDEFQENGRRK